METKLVSEGGGGKPVTFIGWKVSVGRVTDHVLNSFEHFTHPVVGNSLLLETPVVKEDTVIIVLREQRRLDQTTG